MALFSLFQKNKDSLDEDQLIGLVQNRTKNAETTLQDLHRQWFVNIAMRRGHQYVQANAATGVLINPPDQDNRVRLVINKMSGIHQTRVSRLIKDMPKLEVIPASSQDEDKDLARKGTKLLSWLWHNERMVEKLISTSEWMVDTGNCFLYLYWDTDKGTEIETYKRHDGPIEEGLPYDVDEEGFILDAEGGRVPDGVRVGDVAVDIFDPFCIINDGISTDLQDSQWIVIRRAMGLKDIRQRWPERGGEVKSQGDLVQRAYYQRQLMNLGGAPGTYFGTDNRQYEDMAIVDMMFERRSDEFPEGRRVITANGVMLEAGNMPFKHGKYPLIKCSDLDVSGAFWSMGTMELCVPIQKGYNRVWSQIVENGNNLGNVKVWAHKGHGLTREAYDDSGDEFLEVNQGFNVNQLQPAELPAYVVNQLQWYDKAFEDVTGQHEVTNAKVPAGIKSGRAIIALQEQDDTRLAPTKMRFYRAIEEIGYQALQLYAEFQTEDREYRITGTSTADIDEFTISAEEIRSMKKDVRVQTENIIAAHKRLQQEQIADYWEQGLFGQKDNPDVRKKVLSLLEFGNVAELFDEVDLDESQARKENQQFINKKGLQRLPNPDINPASPPGTNPELVFSIPAFDFEDHETHIRVHNRLRKSPRYRQMSAEMRKGLDLHVKMHSIFLGQSAPQPQPAGGPTPSPSPAIRPGAAAPGVRPPPLRMAPVGPPPPVPPPPVG